MNGRLECARLLVELGADKDAKTNVRALRALLCFTPSAALLVNKQRCPRVPIRRSVNDCIGSGGRASGAHTMA